MNSNGPADHIRHSRLFPIDWAALTAAFAIHIALAARLWFVCDDAYITFRYARNLANGMGLRFNPTESPPVEGYSNFLWVVVCAVFEALGLHPAQFAPALSHITAACLIILVYRTARITLQSGPMPAAMAALFLAASPMFATWSSSGLETMPFALAMFLAFERLVLRPERLDPLGGAAACLALSLVRVEGIFWSLFLLGVAILHRRGRQEGLNRDIAQALGLFLLPYLVYWGVALFILRRVLGQYGNSQSRLQRPNPDPGIEVPGLEHAYLHQLTPVIAWDYAAVPKARCS